MVQAFVSGGLRVQGCGYVLGAVCTSADLAQTKRRERIGTKDLFVYFLPAQVWKQRANSKIVWCIMADESHLYSTVCVYVYTYTV